MSDPRPAGSYRAARRNRCLRAEPKSTWGRDWYVPKHKANYSRGYPSFDRLPGKYPLSQASQAAIIRNAHAAAMMLARNLRRGFIGLR